MTTATDIDLTTPTRELDALVAGRILEWKHIGAGYWLPYNDWGNMDEISLPYFSNVIAAAWLIAEKMLNDGWAIKIESRAGFPWFVYFSKGDVLKRGQTLPLSLAICVAALRAKGVVE